MTPPTFLYGEYTIRNRARELADQIPKIVGPDVLLVGVLEGGLRWLAALLDYWPIDNAEYATVRACSYAGRERGTLGVEIPSATLERARGRPVVLVDDIADSGATLNALTARFAVVAKGVASCVMVHKPAAGGDHLPTWAGFTVPGTPFLVGYGLDHNGQYRTLPYLGVLP